MKKFVITGMTASNIANLGSVTFTTSGGDVLIIGQNGAGKSTVKNALMWAMIGSTADGEKLIPYNGEMPTVEVEISDSNIYTQLRKEIFQRTSLDGKIARTTNCFICGNPVNQKKLEQYFSRYVPTDIMKILLELGSFFKLKANDQRKILTEYFGNVTDGDVIASDESLEELLKTELPIESHGRAMKTEMQRIKQERFAIPKQIDELTKQFEEIADDKDEVQLEIDSLKEKLSESAAEYENLQAKMREMNKIQRRKTELNQERWQLQNEYTAIQDKIKSLDEQLKNLRGEWRSVKDKCPTCGQSVKSEKSELIKNEIAARGRGLASEIAKEKSKLQKITARLKTLSENVIDEETDANFDYEEINRVLREREEIQTQINIREKHVLTLTAQINRNEKNRRRIDELMTQEKNLGKELVECEHQLDLVEKFTRRKMAMITDAINANFEHIKFQMFETLKNGEIRNICEATLNGVPYGNLSKGEKLKAALDFVNAIQKIIGVMFPILIDDAESYTSNSLIEVPNQKIVFKVSEGQALHIEVEPKILERRLSA